MLYDPCHTKQTMLKQLEALYLFFANFFATQIIGGAKELVVVL